MPKINNHSNLDFLKQQINAFAAELKLQESTIARNAREQQSAGEAFYKGFAKALASLDGNMLRQVKQLAHNSNFGVHAMQHSLSQPASLQDNVISNLTSKVLDSKQYKQQQPSYQESLQIRNANNHLGALNALTSIALVSNFVEQIKDQVSLKEAGPSVAVSLVNNPFLDNATQNLEQASALRQVIDETTITPVLYNSERMQKHTLFEQEIVNNSFKVKGLVDDAQHFNKLAKDIAKAYSNLQAQEGQQDNSPHNSFNNEPSGAGLGGANVISFAQAAQAAQAAKNKDGNKR